MGALSLFPCLVVIIITPFAAREPYNAAEAASFNTVIDAISEDAMEERAQVSSVSKALQGTVAGLQSFSSSGQPGSDATILIRGVGSVNASTNPLYVVDGVPYDGAFSIVPAAI